jgi:hypothetical protein
MRPVKSGLVPRKRVPIPKRLCSEPIFVFSVTTDIHLQSCIDLSVFTGAGTARDNRSRSAGAFS